MKKILLTLLVSGVLLHTYAQTPEEKSFSLFSKITATWCGPCGDWGWDIGHSVEKGLGDKGYYLGLFASNNPSNDNGKFYNATALAIARNFGFTGFPTFHVNGVDVTKGQTTISGYKNSINKALNDHQNDPLIASPAAHVEMSETSITANVKAKFWAETEGEYYLASYLIEEGALNKQNGRGSKPVEHSAVLRASLTKGHWGEKITEGSVAAGEEFSQTFTYEVTKSDWDRNKFAVYTIIWKKEGSKYTYVNMSKSVFGTTSVDRFTNIESLRVFPNPAVNHVLIELTSKESTSINVRITDNLGRLVYSSGNIKINQGTNNHLISLDNFSSGLYNISILSGTETATRKLTVLK